ncbi:MAG: hypothetical protein GXY60_08295 [Spirochaetales bacterium]|nr:hypothetical protein [Spirochaetales bacterium]
MTKTIIWAPATHFGVNKAKKIIWITALALCVLLAGCRADTNRTGGKGDLTDENNSVAVGNDLMTMDESIKHMSDEELKEYVENRNENQRENLEDLGPYTLEKAIDLLRNVMDSRGEKATKFMIDDDTINGEHAFIIAAGEDSPDGDQFIASYHYAVTDSGKVYFLDPVSGPDWILIDPDSVG